MKKNVALAMALCSAVLVLLSGCYIPYERTISGIVYLNDTGMLGVEVQVGTTTCVTDSDGYYSIVVDQDTSYTVTPSLAGYVFSPDYKTVDVSDGDQLGIDFEAQASSSSSAVISGIVTSGSTGLSGVTIAVGGTSVQTDANGVFSAPNLSAGTYVVTPSRSGYTFVPVSATIVVVSGHAYSGNVFKAIAPPSISGMITIGVVGLSGVQVMAELSGKTSGLTGTSDNYGNYVIKGLANGTYTLIPSLTNYKFTPTSLQVSVVGSNLTGENFTAARISN
jgi:hypothetical protein